MSFNIGERVWWKTTESTILRGTIRELEDRPGVQTDDEAGLLYLDAEQLHRVIPEDDGLYTGISDVDYHADKASLSSSGARRLLRSPAKFRWQLDQPPETGTHFDVGHFVHAKVLGVGQPVVIIDASDYKTKAAQRARDEAYAAGHIPMLRTAAAEAQQMAEAILAHTGAKRLLEGGTPELSVYWHDLATKVRLRARFDSMREFPDGRQPLVVDVKTTGTSAAPEDFAAAAGKYQLHFQNAWYDAAVRAIGIHPDGARFVFINVEKDPPYLVSLTQLQPSAIALGAQRVRRAIDLYAQCLATDHWPGYGDDIHTVDLPRWTYFQEEQIA
ncbi:PD-(D/E)XK nuclease-like domain-containing protein [Mycobacterium kansasii]|uniref:PD-(D/E)XK nuclease-like domain-containing protein n=1 Tax=Mycobacterium kansasii TaxID=1768 RepID=UPI000CDE4A57|nr:PD-(D/E)XK nuclease-like domain-containing protein [Mycobacterium kansasii]POY10461.1 recE [Mycobacterium kansasii]